MLRRQHSVLKLSQSSHYFEARSDKVTGYKTRSVTQNITVNDAGTFPPCKSARQLVWFIIIFGDSTYVESSEKRLSFVARKWLLL